MGSTIARQKWRNMICRMIIRRRKKDPDEPIATQPLQVPNPESSRAQTQTPLPSNQPGKSDSQGKGPEPQVNAAVTALQFTTIASNGEPTTNSANQPNSKSKSPPRIGFAEGAEERDASKTQTLMSISALWDEVYDELAEDKATAEIIADYEQALTKSTPFMQLSRERDKRREQLEKLVEKKTREVEEGTWKIGFKGREFAVKDLVKPVVSIIEWGKDYGGEAVQVSPPASIAWAGVCLLLPLLLNPGHHEKSRVDGLDKIASIIRECSLRESIYRSRYETTPTPTATTKKPQTRPPTPPHRDYKESIKALYSQIITFQATYVCFFSNHNTAARWLLDAVKLQDWDTMIQAITLKNGDIKSLDHHWRDYMQQEEWAAMAKRHDENLEMLDALREEIQRFYDLVSTAKREQDRSSLLSWLQTVTPSTHHDAAVAQRRKYATGRWFLQSGDFTNWERGPNSFLWVIGKPGAGKSVLSSTVIQHLEESHKTDPYTAVVYFYIRGVVKDTCNINNLTRSLVTQLFGCRPDTPKSLLELGDYRLTSGAPPQEKLEEALRSAAQDFTRTYIVIDGVDECPNSGDYGSGQGQRRVLLELLETIQQWGLDNVHLLVTSRREQDIGDAMEKLVESPQAQVFDLATTHNLASVSEDIGLFIDEEFGKGIFKRVSAELKAKVKTKLLNKAGGVFHYVSLQLGAFQVPITENSVQETLQNLPKDLNETYDGALARLAPDQRQKAIRALTWVAFSQVPLTIEELAAAMPINLVTTRATATKYSSSGDDTSSNRVAEWNNYSAPLFSVGDRIQDPLHVLYLLPGLYNLQNTQHTEMGDDRQDHPMSRQAVVLTHLTLLEYLTSDAIKKPGTFEFALNKTTANLQIADACLRYHIHVSQNTDDDSIATPHSSKLRAEYPLWKYVASHGLRHAETVGRKAWPASLKRLIQALFLQDEDGKGEAFAKLKACSDYRSKGSRPAHDDRLPIHYAVDENLLETAAFFLEEGLADANAAPNSGGRETPLVQGVNNMNTEMVRLLLDHGANANARTEAGDSALFRAISNGDAKTARLLLESGGADVNASNPAGETALFHAIVSQQYSLAMQLLQLKNKPNVNAKTKTAGETPLHWAACYGHDALVERLLDLGADANAATAESGETPLLWAADTGQGQVVRTLLLFFSRKQKNDEHQDLARAKNNKEETALHLAARDGNVEMALLLLEHGADVDARTTVMGETALHFAAKRADEIMLEVLLEHGADANAANEAGETAMYLAARKFS
ncbi:hypothetical protein B0H63DRAFT_427281 [Podospora didyma]|uniref:NACHT domain-containing protein n=1 Tax=Podospora didyma TaxID=330526 RepID=A0AAE0U987_9PEZI|nr:hypothetical protein B0H63DRAFT_427281 [Podospora didyma]